MKKFTISMRAQMDLKATVIVRAKTQEEALDKAHAMSYNGKIKWEDTGVDGDTVSAEIDGWEVI